MAEGSSSSEKALEKLNEELTCPICLDQYTDPKLLHCFHVFCEKCLKPVARQTPQGQVVECPNCRHLTSLPQEGVSGLQGAFLIHHLFDIQDILKKVSTPAGIKCTKCEKRDPACYCRSCGFLCAKCKDIHSEWKEFSSHELVSLDQLTADATNLVPPVQKTLNCSKHPTKELDLYCETCKEVICQYCVLKIHRDHQYDLATDAFPQQKKVLVSSVEPVEQQLASVNKALEDLKSLSVEITSQRQALETKIRAEIRLGHQALEAREEVLVSQLDQMTREKLKNVAAQQDQLELVATRLKSCCGFLQESLRTGSQVEILAMAKPFLQQVQDVTSSIKPESLEPEEQANLEFNCSQNELLQMCQQYGQVFAIPVVKCSAEGDGLKLAVVGERTTATVEAVKWKGRKYSRPVEVSCELVSSDGSRRVRGEAKKVRDGEFEIGYLPQHRGPHYLHIRVGDKHISGSPFPLSVITTTPTNIITGVKYPWGLALDNKGQLVVVEHVRHCVTIFSGSGEKVRSFGSEGSGPGQLSGPYGVALSATGDILVADQCNHRIQVFHPNGKVQVFTADGEYIRQFEKGGSGKNGIALDSN
ncbi:Tripartite motif-containing protein 2, partial [Geodia barretti]